MWIDHWCGEHTDGAIPIYDLLESGMDSCNFSFIACKFLFVSYWVDSLSIFSQEFDFVDLFGQSIYDPCLVNPKPFYWWAWMWIDHGVENPLIEQTPVAPSGMDAFNKSLIALNFLLVSHRMNGLYLVRFWFCAPCLANQYAAHCWRFWSLSSVNMKHTLMHSEESK